MQIPYIIYDQNGRNQLTLIPYLWPDNRKTIPFGAAHTYIADIREYPPPPGDAPLPSQSRFCCFWWIPDVGSWPQDVGFYTWFDRSHGSPQKFFALAETPLKASKSASVSIFSRYFKIIPWFGALIVSCWQFPWPVSLKLLHHLSKHWIYTYKVYKDVLDFSYRITC